jgi:peptide/nickel transport system substrate-binding protein
VNVWLSSGAMHLWNPAQKTPATAWEAEIDQLMRAQMFVRKYGRRKQMFDRVQEILAGELPVIPLVSPHVLGGARQALANFQPALLDHNTLWKVDELYWSNAPGARR